MPGMMIGGVAAPIALAAAAAAAGRAGGAASGPGGRLGGKWMKPDDVEYVVRSLLYTVANGVPYVEDYYYQVGQQRGREGALGGGEAAGAWGRGRAGGGIAMPDGRGGEWAGLRRVGAVGKVVLVVLRCGRVVEANGEGVDVVAG